MPSIIHFKSELSSLGGSIFVSTTAREAARRLAEAHQREDATIEIHTCAGKQMFIPLDIIGAIESR